MKFVVLLAFLVATAYGFGTLCNPKPSTRLLPPSTTMPANLQVAFLGDAGANTNQRRVLQMVSDWGADFIIHSGDFEYENDPELFEDNLNAVLGPDYPYFASIGNHDTVSWGTENGNGHLARFLERMERANTTGNCEGDFGVNMVCDYKGMLFVLSGVGTRGSGHEDYIDEVLSARAKAWKFVSWHKNQRLMQIGGKTNEVGWEAYDTTRVYGAFIATGHEHSYCRSYMMSDYEDQDIANTNQTLNLRTGQSFVFVSGLAGVDIRDWEDDLVDNPWWAAVGANDNNIQYGALLCTFNINGNPKLATCIQRDINGRTWDDFDIVSQLPTTEEELAAEVKVQKDKEAKKCRSRFVEIPITHGRADVIEDAESGELKCKSDVISFSKKSHAALKFENIPLKKGEKVAHAYLQLYGATTSKENPSFTISGRLGHGFKSFQCGKKDLVHQLQRARDMQATEEKSKIEISWEKEDEGWEIQNVWVSPDLAGIVNELVNKERWQEEGDMVFDIIGSGAQGFNTFESSPCFSPTLAIEIAPSC